MAHLVRIGAVRLASIRLRLRGVEIPRKSLQKALLAIVQVLDHRLEGAARLDHWRCQGIGDMPRIIGAEGQASVEQRPYAFDLLLIEGAAEHRRAHPREELRAVNVEILG